MSRKPRTGDVVEIAWTDSEVIQLGWQPVEAYLKAADHPHGYRTAGYWIEGSKKNRAVVALSIDPFDGTITHVMQIPKVAITKVKVLGRSNASVRKMLR